MCCPAKAFPKNYATIFEKSQEKPVIEVLLYWGQVGNMEPLEDFIGA
jgi:hypothetical protein